VRRASTVALPETKIQARKPITWLHSPGSPEPRRCSWLFRAWSQACSMILTLISRQSDPESGTILTFGSHFAAVLKSVGTQLREKFWTCSKRMNTQELVLPSYWRSSR
jgi:hypothetical protein